MSIAQASHSRQLQPTRHARNRWHERGDQQPIEDAIQLAERVSETEQPTQSYDADELRLYAPGWSEVNLLLIVRGTSVITVLPPKSQRLDLAVFDRCEHCDSITSFAVADGCPYCNETVRRYTQDQTDDLPPLNHNELKK